MNKNFKYFMIPYDQIPNNVSYKLWFGTWSIANPTITWSQDRPAPPDGVSTWAVGLTTGAPAVSGVTSAAAVASGATPLGDGGKDLPPPPMRLSNPSSPTAFQDAVAQWLLARSL